MSKMEEKEKQKPGKSIGKFIGFILRGILIIACVVVGVWSVMIFIGRIDSLLNFNWFNFKTREVFLSIWPRLTFPTPSGYCAVSDETAKSRFGQKQIGKFDGKTLFSSAHNYEAFVNCKEFVHWEKGEPVSGYAILVSLRDETGKHWKNREEFLNYLEFQEFQPQNIETWLSPANVSEETEKPVRKFRIIAKDKSAIYIETSNKDQGYLWASTVIRKQRVDYFLFGKYRDKQSMKHLLKNSEEYIKAVIDENEVGLLIGCREGFFFPLRLIASIFWNIDLYADDNTNINYFIGFVAGIIIGVPLLLIIIGHVFSKE